jgi:hypothetical protein
VNRLHVIFDLNGVLEAKEALGSCIWMWTNSTLALKPRLKKILRIVYLNLMFIFGLFHDVTTSTNI